jgi:hypothetical protein
MCREARKAKSIWSDTAGATLAFVEVRTRTAREDQAALPELSVTFRKAADGGENGAPLSVGAPRKGMSDAF